MAYESLNQARQPQLRKGFTTTVSSQAKKPLSTRNPQSGQKKQGLPMNGVLIGVGVQKNVSFEQKEEVLPMTPYSQQISKKNYAELSVIQSVGTRDQNTNSCPSSDTRQESSPVIQDDQRHIVTQQSQMKTISNELDSDLSLIKQMAIDERRKSFLDPLPIFIGGFRGNEPSNYGKSQRKSVERVVTQSQQNLSELAVSVSNFVTAMSQETESNLSLSKATEISRRDCKHLKIRSNSGICANCGSEVAQYGSIFDTSTIKSFIKVLFVDESKRTPSLPLPEVKVEVQEKVKDEPDMVVVKGGSNIARYAPKEQVHRTVNQTTVEASDYIEQFPTIIYESYTPENTHQMREYILHVMIKNQKRMRKGRLVSEAAFKKFKLPKGQDDVKNALTAFETNQKKKNGLLDPEYLRFDSAIESGNLERAEAFPINHNMVDIARASHQTVIQKYNLFCKVDTNTKGHQQWFYFRLKNTKKNTRYQFSICNFTKPFSLFKQGMQIQLLSKRQQALYVENLEAQIADYKATLAANDEEDSPQSQTKRVEIAPDARLLMEQGIVREQWQPAGEKIEYVKSHIERAGWNLPGPINIEHEEDDNVDQDDLGSPGIASEKQVLQKEHYQQRFKRYFYQMNFELEFPFEDDTVYIAYSRPYPYSQIIAHMFETEQRLEKANANEKVEVKEKAKGFKYKIARQHFVYTRELLCTTISGLPVPSISITSTRTSVSKKQIIFVTARVHPGETNASSVFEGFLDKLTDSIENSPILSHFIIKLVPCMNPDGVVCGNYRSSLAGVDLNRQWILPSQELHPEVFHTKAMMHQLTKVEHRKILIYCDIHCHSKKKNSFLYGCNTAAEGAPFSTWTQVRLLPRLLARRSKYVSLPSCRFGIEACKMGTARVVVWKEFQVMNSFTLENSFYGYDHGPETRLYTQECYKQIGGSLAITLNDYRLCVTQMEKEMIELKGWLKPMKLKEITGVPAAEVIAQEIKQKKIMSKKAEFIRKYQARLGNIAIPSLNQHLLMRRPTITNAESPATPVLKSKLSLTSQKKLTTAQSQIAQQKQQINDKIKERSTEQSDVQISTTAPNEHILAKELIKLIEEEIDEDQEGAVSAQQSQRLASDKGGAVEQEGEASDEGAGPSEEQIDLVDQVDTDLVAEDLRNINNDLGRQQTQSGLQTMADKVNEMTNDIEIEAVVITQKNLSSMTKRENLVIIDEKGVVTPPVHSILTVRGKSELKPQNQSQKNKSIVGQGGRDSCQTLLAESEQKRRSLLQKKRYHNQEVMMRGNFGDQPIRESSMLLGPSKTSNLENYENYEEEFLDEHGEQITAAQGHSTSFGDGMAGRGLDNWRQLFDQEELNNAYQQSIIVSRDVKIEVKAGAKQHARDPSKQRIDESKDDAVSFSENDDSADDDSVDDLNEFQLLRQVYMQKESLIEQAMRSTARAQFTFMNEVKIMIKSKKHDKRLAAHKQSQKTFWEQVNASNGSYYEPASTYTHEKGTVHDNMPLQLTGVQIERPFQPVSQEKIKILAAKIGKSQQLRPGQMQTHHSQLKGVIQTQQLDTLSKQSSPTKKQKESTKQLPQTVDIQPQLRPTVGKDVKFYLSDQRDLKLLQAMDAAASQAEPDQQQQTVTKQQYTLKVQIADHDSIGMKIKHLSLKQGVKMKAHRQQHKLVTSIEVKNRERQDSDHLIEVDDIADSTLLTHRFSTNIHQQKNSRSPSTNNIGAKAQKASKLRTNAAKKRAPVKQDQLPLPPYSLDRQTPELPAIQSESQSLKAPKIIQHNHGRNLAARHLGSRGGGSHFNTVQLAQTNNPMPDIVQSQIVCSQKSQLSRQQIVENPTQSYYITTQNSMTDTRLAPVHLSIQSPLQYPTLISGNSPGHENDANNETVLLNKDLKDAAGSRMKKMTVMLEDKRDISELKKQSRRPKPPGLIGQINICINSSRSHDPAVQDEVVIEEDSSAKVTIDPAQEFQLRKAAQLSAMMNGGNIGTEVLSTQEKQRLMRQAQLLQSIQPANTLQNLQENQVFSYLRNNSSENRQISSLLMQDSALHGVIDSSDKKRSNDNFQKYVARSIQNVKNEHIRRSYADQLEKNKSRANSHDHQVSQVTPTSRHQLSDAVFKAMQSSIDERRNHILEQRLQENPDGYKSPVSRHAHDLIYNQAVGSLKLKSNSTKLQEQVLGHSASRPAVVNEYLDSSNNDPAVVGRLRDKSAKQKMEDSNTTKLYGLEGSRYSVGRFQAHIQHQQSPMMTPKARYGRNNKTTKSNGLPTIAQSIDNAKILSTQSNVNARKISDIQEVQSSIHKSQSRASDFSVIEAGCLEDQNSLAKINIIQVANSGISPINTTIISKTKQLKSRFAVESLQGGRPPDLLKINKSRHMKLKSLLSGNDDKPQPLMDDGPRTQQKPKQNRNIGDFAYPAPGLQRSAADLHQQNESSSSKYRLKHRRSQERLPILYSSDKSFVVPAMPPSFAHSPRYRPSQSRSLVAGAIEAQVQRLNSRNRKITTVPSDKQMLMQGKNILQQDELLAISPPTFRLNQHQQMRRQ